MALRIDIDRKLLESLIEQSVASCRRGINASKRPEFKVVYEKEIEILYQAKASITELETPPKTTK